MLPPLSFILGGASSGKSAFAESIVILTRKPRIYIATAQAFDAEMDAKVAAHKAQRGPGWTTLEEPLKVASTVATLPADAVALLDCATLWLTNVLLAERDLDRECERLIAALSASPCPVVVVSNEVGLGIVPDNALSRRFRAAQGQLNQNIAAEADLVVNVVAGLPHVLKGTLPT